MNESFSIEQLLKQAIELHQAGQLQEAELLYRKILMAEPSHPDANHNLGTLARQTGKDQEAVPYYKAAFDVNPAGEQYALSYAAALIVTNTVREALIAIFDAAKHAEAEALGRSLVQLQPEGGMGWKALGLALHLQDKPAMVELGKAVELLPLDPNCHLNLATELLRAGRFAEAANAYQAVTELNPDFLPARQNLAHTLMKLGRYEEALDHYAKAIALDQSDADMHNYHGAALLELKQFQLATDSFQRAINCQPKHAVAHNNLGFALVQLGSLELALDAIQQALQLEPDWIEALNNLAIVQRELRQLDAAEATYRKALAIKPDHPYLYGSWLQTCLRSGKWEEFDHQLAELEQRVHQSDMAITPFALLSISGSRSLQAKMASLFLSFNAQAQARLPPIEKKHGRGKIRIGYFSADFYEHATAYLMAELFERHNRQQFEVFAYSFGPATRDPMQLRLMAAFDQFIEVLDMSDRDVALLARQHELDIAVDLKGFTQNCRTGIFAARAAPIQVNYLGYPGTMGAPFIDYLIADPILIPTAHRADYSEKIAYLPHSYQVNDRQRHIADKAFTRAELGLPEQGFVFCCFNNNYKILPKTFDCWMRILRAVEGSVLWLFEDNAEVGKNLRQEAELRGVSANRLVFAQRMPLAEHLARQRMADLFLDTLPYNAHTTASDALWVGLPVLTLIGDTFAGRVAASLLNAIHLPELITSTESEFEALAIALANDPARLHALRRKLDANRLSTPLFDAALFARDLESAYSKMVERLDAGLVPDHLM